MFSDLDHAFPSDARPPYMNSGDISGVLGSNLELPCTPPRGKPAPVVRWKKDGSPLDLGRKWNHFSKLTSLEAEHSPPQVCLFVPTSSGSIIKKLGIGINWEWIQN